MIRADLGVGHVGNANGSYMSPTIARKVVQYFQPKQRQKQQLTPRQEQIVEGIVRGDSYDMIAANLMISLSTVQDHIKKIYRKLQIHSKGELIQKRVSGEV